MIARTVIRITNLSISLVFLAFLGGCASFNGYPKDPQDDSGTLKTLLAKYFSPGYDNSYASIKTDAQNYDLLRQAARNDIINGQIHVYDILFSKLQRAMSEYGNSISIGGDLTALVLNGLGATTGNASVKSALAAASAGIIGAQGVINKDLYYQKTLPALIAQMDANREKIKASVLQKQSQTDSAYPLSRAEIDLDSLIDAGSLNNAVSNISQQATTQKNNAVAAEQMYQSTHYVVTPSTTKLQSWLYPSGQLSTTNFNALQTWLSNNSDVTLQNVPVAVFVSADSSTSSLEAARQRAITDLKIP